MKLKSLSIAGRFMVVHIRGGVAIALILARKLVDVVLAITRDWLVTRQLATGWLTIVKPFPWVVLAGWVMGLL